MPVEFCYKVAVPLAVTWFYPVGLSCPEYLVRMLKCSITESHYYKKSAEIVIHINITGNFNMKVGAGIRA